MRCRPIPVPDGGRARRFLAVPALLGLGLLVSAAAPLRDAPIVWYENDRAEDIAEPREREPSLIWEGPRAIFVRPVGRLTHPGRVVRKIGTWFGGDPVLPAANVNRLDEVPNSSWFTNRIGLFPMSPETAARGPGDSRGPDKSDVWTVVGAKIEGVTPGFRIRDPKGDVFFIKFDPAKYPGMASAAAVISGKILYAAGYNVPEDVVVEFDREDLVLGEDVRITLPDGSKRTMTDRDLDGILSEVAPDKTMGIRAIASKLLAGKPVGPFAWRGRRKDDANDHINHEDRRELRGLRMIAAWIEHFDAKQHNTLDMYVNEDGGHFVRHHLLDFASTLGTGAAGPNQSFGFEYSIDIPAISGRLLSLGFHEDAWRKLERPPGLAEIGYFESKLFDPIEFKPMTPNAAFANLTDRDGYWAAKIISAFNDEQLLAITATGKFQDPRAAAYMAKILGERRDKIARYWFMRVPPLDFFRYSEGRLSFHDLGVERGLFAGTTTYRARMQTMDDERDGPGWLDWIPSDTPQVISQNLSEPTSTHAFLAYELQLNRGDGWSSLVRVVVTRESTRVIGVER